MLELKFSKTSENTKIHMGTGNISQIPDIYFVNEFFIPKKKMVGTKVHGRLDVDKQTIFVLA